MQVRWIVEKLAKRCGFEAVARHMPEGAQMQFCNCLRWGWAPGCQGANMCTWFLGGGLRWLFDRPRSLPPIRAAHAKLLSHIRKENNRKERRRSEAGSQVGQLLAQVVRMWS